MMKMRDLTWPAVAIFAIVVAAIVALFWLTDDAALRNQLVGHFDALVLFAVGAAAGGAGGGAVAYYRGIERGKAL